ncbi:phage major capsid protein [Brachyspira pilosicoli]|uniref:phage major capsid protein n=1 Tax=Brachyspira pilosicoli TaxID=52584 RepID=UPI000E183D89|nr:phage major capsid protein [Brachyspira pilosicoli]SUW04308.1 phage major capsid protein-like protein [Brachyspira pilosicoli]SUW07973.1 phage major capsid protein-like protein [Brachyspira pilosicoli]
MTPEDLRTKIANLKSENASDLTRVEDLISQRDLYSAMSLEERANKKEDISKLDNDIDTLMQNIENRNKEIERNDKLLSLQTKSSMNKRNIVDDLDSSTANNDTELRDKVTRWFRTGDDKEVREELQAGVAEAGGNTIAPQYLVKDIIKGLDSSVEVRKRAYIIPAMNGYASIGIPTLENDLNDLEWTPEIGEVTEDKNMSFGKREMKPNQLTKLVKVSRKLIRDSNIDVQKLVQDRIAYKLAATLEKNYLYGNGTGKPLGIFAQTSDNSTSIPTDRDIAVGTATAPITYDGLVDAVSGLKSGYQQGAVWMFNKKAVAALRKLKDKQDRSIWQESMISGQPSLLLGIPVVQNDFIEDKLESTQYFGVLANLSHYWIMDSLSMELQVLYELYSQTNQVGFQVGYYGDGAPVQKDAFVRLLAHDKPFAKPSTESAG